MVVVPAVVADCTRNEPARATVNVATPVPISARSTSSVIVSCGSAGADPSDERDSSCSV